MVDLVPLVIAVLATWRVSHLAAREDGPLDVILFVDPDGLAGLLRMGVLRQRR